MIIDKIIHECRSCESQTIIKNGFSPSGKQKYICKHCGYNGVINPQQGYSEEEIEDTLLPSEEEDILELEEVCSFVKERKNKKWLWVALCRRTRQVVAYIIGDRSERSCRELWEVIPEKYKNLHSYSDFWDAYRKILPVGTHRSVGKESGETNHIERWNNTLRQSLGRYTRKTLSFSKSEFFHYVVTHLFVRKYNLSKNIIK